MRKLVAIREVEEFPIYDITVENDHCFELHNGVLAHNSMFPKEILGGGTGIYYSADNIFILGRQQEKDGTDTIGYNFIINVEKSRYVREKSKIPVTVSFDSGLSKWSGLLDIAMEGGFVVKPSNGWYSKVDVSTGAVEEKKYRNKDTNCAEFWDSILESTEFAEYVKKQYALSSGQLMQQEEPDIDLDDERGIR